MFTPKAAGRFPSKAKGLGSRSGTPMSGPRRTGSLLTPRGGNTPVARSQVVETTGSHVAQVWGSTLPVLVTEVLTRSSDGTQGEVTVSLGSSGWAWLVSGRRLVVWRYRAGGGRSQCRELSLPPSDLSHRAELCLVYSAPGSGHTPCCLAVSPEGVVRYWPSIAQEGSSSEISAELGGQECCSVTALQPLGCLLATTTATLVLISHSGQTVACRRLAPPTGLLGGLGRRVSSLLWGQNTAGSAGEGRLVRVAGAGDTEEAAVLFVLTSNGLQKWQLGEEAGEDRLYYEADVAGLCREAVWASQPRGEGSAAWLRLWLLDLSVEQGRATVLVAAVDQNSATPVLQYGLATLRASSPAPPLSLSSFTPLPGLASVLAEGEEPRQYKVESLGDWAYVYGREGVTTVNMREMGEQERIPGHILGAGRTDTAPLFFSSQHGVLSLDLSSPAPSLDHSTMDTSMAADTTARLSESLNCSVSAKGLQDLTMSESLTDQLKAAFLQFCRSQSGQAQAIVDELFPPGAGDPLDSSLDRLVVALSQDLMDDFPQSDPRWVESLPQSTAQGQGSSLSLLVLHQLEDKLACHDFYITFLKAVGLWSRLAALTVRGQPMATVTLLEEHAEKTVGAITLRSLHPEHQATMDQAIRICLADREVTASGSLTDQDHFYREISRVDDLLPALLAVLRFSVRSSSPRQLLATVTSVNTVLLSLLRECLAARTKRSPASPPSSLEYFPWTATRRPLLLELARLGLEQGVPACEEAQQRNSLYRQVVELGDVVLDSYLAQLASLGRGDREASLRQSYHRDRSLVIGLLVDRKVYEEAAGLAEKYQDFDLLVKICEESGNKEKLEAYMERFREQDFSSHVFSWYVKEGKQSRLLSLGSSAQTKPELTSFLSHHSAISWLHDLHTGEHGKAAATLQHLAAGEREVLARRKTQLCLAKLCSLATGRPQQEEARLQELDQQMALVAAQEQLPASVLRQFGFDRETMRVLTAREMIELYVGEENVEADHIDFKKALDLVAFAALDSEEKEQTWLHIWCRSILRNTWTDIDVDNPLESVRDTVFFRLVEFAFMQGAELQDYLPRPEVILTCEELGGLRENSNFQYLIQTGYEQIQRVCAS